jgi:hypothetical protein
MSPSKKVIQLTVVAAFLTLVFFLHKLNTENIPRKSWAEIHREMYLNISTPSSSRHKLSSSTLASISDPHPRPLAAPFRPGTPKPAGAAYTRIVIIPRMKDENVSWIIEEIPDIPTAIYVANDPFAPLHPPRNKGHEVMIYLTYIIDHYENLPDILIFMHAHRHSHHNADLLNHDAVQMIRRLSSDHVTRVGYFNMRCQWNPGCPEWLHPADARESLERQEEVVLSRSWAELFPSEPLPRALGQPCCAQFALSRERVQSIPLSRFVFYRDWMLRTPLSDYVSGRIWEYSWQFLFTGESLMCPEEHVCWCDGFGVCFGGEEEYGEFERLRDMRERFEGDLKGLQQQRLDNAEQSRTNGSAWTLPDPGRYSHLTSQIAALDNEVGARKQAALERGLDPENRARECGRSWNEADDGL